MCGVVNCSCKCVDSLDVLTLLGVYCVGLYKYLLFPLSDSGMFHLMMHY